MNNTELAIKTLTVTLEDQLKKELTKQLTQKLITQFKADVEPVVADIVKDVTIAHIEQVRTVLDWSDELNIDINGVRIK